MRVSGSFPWYNSHMNLPPEPMPLNPFSALPGTAVLAFGRTGPAVRRTGAVQANHRPARRGPARRRTQNPSPHPRTGPPQAHPLRPEGRVPGRRRAGRPVRRGRPADQAAIEEELERLAEAGRPAPRKPRIRAGRTCRITAQSQTVALTATLPPPRLPAIRLPPVRGHRRRPCPCVRH